MNAMLVAPLADRSPTLPAMREDGFVALDACHCSMLEAADALEALVAVAELGGLSLAVRASAAAIAEFYATTAAQHHEDEERHVFPALLASRDPDLVRAVTRLQEDHERLEECWNELEPHVLAIAAGYGIEVDLLREAVQAFAALHRDHIKLEESLAYPEARRHLGDDGCCAMGREMMARDIARRAQRKACFDPR
jgi:hemerythrin-like domain-containing protein